MKLLIIICLSTVTLSAFSQTRMNLRQGESIEVKCLEGEPKFIQNARGAIISCASVCRGEVRYTAWGLTGKYTVPGEDRWGREIEYTVGPTSTFSGLSNEAIQKRMEIRAEDVRREMMKDHRCEEYVVEMVNERL